MSSPISVCQWSQEVSRHFPHLSRPQANVLALYSLGIMLANDCGLSRVCQCLANVLGQKRPTIRQRVREWRNEAEAKTGTHRQEVQVGACFAPLLGWVLRCLPDDQPLVLALDASSLSDRFVVLSVSVMIRSCAIPVAWHIRPARLKGSWKPLWLHLLDLVHAGVSMPREVLVMTDRGLYARWLYRHIQRYQWHPFMRLNRGIKARPEGCTRGSPFEPVERLVPEVGCEWSGKVTCFSSSDKRVHASLLARWEAGYTDPWLILTDLPPQQAQACWYRWRSWIECSFKDLKGGGWNWQRARTHDAGRMERMWLAMAIASLLVVLPGSQQEDQEPHPSLDKLPPTHIARRAAAAAQERRATAAQAARDRGDPEPPEPRPRRELSCFLRGCLWVSSFFFQLTTFDGLHLVPEPLPQVSALPVRGGFWGTG